MFARRTKANDSEKTPVTPLELATEWRSEAAFIGRGHYKAADRTAWWDKVAGVITTLLSAAIGALLLHAGKEGPISATLTTYLGLLSLVASALTAIQARLRYDDVSQQHRGAGAAYEVLGRELDVLIAEEAHGDMDRLKALRQRMNELDKTTPLIPPRAYRRGRDEIVECKGHLSGRGRPRGVLVHTEDDDGQRCRRRPR